jgi:uncharacterized protein (DUF1778 family)
MNKKSETINVRVEKKIKDALTKMATAQRRDLSDFLRLLLTDIVEKKIKINL